MSRLPAQAVNACSATVLLLACSATAKAATEFVAGDVVVAKRAVSLKIAERVTDSVEAGAVLQVQFVRGDWLWVTNRHSGYIHVSQVTGGEEAQAALAQRIARNPADVGARRARGYIRLLEGDADGAIAEFDAVLNLSTVSPLFHSDRGNAWLSKGHYERALADYNRAILHEGASRLAKFDRANLYCGRGLALLLAGAVGEAVRDFGVAIRLSDGRLAVAYYRRGLAFLGQGNANERAIADFHRAIELNKLDVAAINARGLAWLRLGMFQKAAKDFRNAINKSANGPFVRSTRSGLLYNQLAASENWPSEAAGRITPTDSAYYNLVILLAAGPDGVRDGAEARACAEKVCRLDNDRYYAFQEALAAACAAESDFENARRRQRQAIALAPNQEIKKKLERQLANYDEGEPYRWEAP
jgi:tetratricopeptide (TPR) repeat protein